MESERKILTLWYSQRLFKISVIMIMYHEYGGEFSCVLCTPIQYFHWSHSLYWNLSKKWKLHALSLQFQPWTNEHTHHWSVPHGKPLFLFRIFGISYLLKMQCHPHCTTYIYGNISASQPTWIAWLIMGRSSLPNFSFIIFSSLQFFLFSS